MLQYVEPINVLILTYLVEQLPLSVAVCCSVLQCVAMRCSVLQCVAVLQCVEVYSVLQCVEPINISNLTYVMFQHFKSRFYQKNRQYCKVSFHI